MQEQGRRLIFYAILEKKDFFGHVDDRKHINVVVAHMQDFISYVCDLKNGSRRYNKKQNRSIIVRQLTDMLAERGCIVHPPANNFEVKWTKD